VARGEGGQLVESGVRDGHQAAGRRLREELEERVALDGDGRADAVADHGLGEGLGDAAVGDVVGAAQEAALGRGGQELVQAPLAGQVGLGDPARGLAVDDALVGRAVERRRAVAGDEDDITLLTEGGADCQRCVVEDADHADHRRRVDRPAVVLVVERDVARDDREPERLAGERHPLDRLGQLVADVGRLGVAEVEAVRDGGRAGAGAGHVAGRLADGAHPAAARVERGAPAVPVERDRDRAL